MYALVVILSEEKQETGVLYFFSYDMSSLVIQVFRTVSHSKQKLPKTVSFFFFSPERSIFKERENLLQAHKHSVDMHIFLLIVMEYKRTMVELETSDMHFLNSQAKLECVGLKDLSPFLYRK